MSRPGQTCRALLIPPEETGPLSSKDVHMLIDTMAGMVDFKWQSDMKPADKEAWHALEGSPQRIETKQRLEKVMKRKRKSMSKSSTSGSYTGTDEKEESGCAEISTVL